MKKAFEAYELEFDKYCVVLPRVTLHKDFLRLMRSCNAMLDTPMWAGGRTTIEGISQGLPVVTWPGPYMRAAFTSGILQMIDYKDTIAGSVEEYVDIAVNLANDELEYNRLVQKMQNNHKRAFDDVGFVKNLEYFISCEVQENRKRIQAGVGLFES